MMLKVKTSKFESLSNRKRAIAEQALEYRLNRLEIKFDGKL